jgi:signal transduction histidine kinase
VGFEMTVSGTARQALPVLEEHLLRIGQEAINNALRHANPTRLRVDLCYERDAIKLDISDDGCGFVVTDADIADHYGLKSMNERAEQMGGQLQIVSKPQGGTKVEVAVPWVTNPASEHERV